MSDEPKRPGPRIRTDLVDVYVFRRTRVPSRLDPSGEARGGGERIEFLQLRRAGTEPLSGTWQCIMGHVEPGETAIECAWRELSEEAGLTPRDPALLGFWALEQVHPYYLPSRDAIMMSPRFATEVAPDWTPTLNDEHDDARWVSAADAMHAFMWPGQRACVREIMEFIVPRDSEARVRQRIEP